MIPVHPTGKILSRVISKITGQVSGFFLAFVLITVFSSCEKDPGTGGNSMIKGTIIEREYALFPDRYEEAGAKDVDVYIIYGDEGNAFDDRTRTSYDGSYKFESLKKGKYRVFVYTDDTTSTSFGNTSQVIREVEITKNRSEKEVSQITIIKL